MFDLNNTVFSKLSKQFNRDLFACSNESLDSFLKKFALQNQNNNLGQTWIFHYKDSVEIIGFYTLSTASVKRDDFSLNYSKGLPSYPIPCILLGKLAVDTNFQNKGIGKYLLFDFLVRVAKISKEIGCFAVIVDAKNEKVAEFYKKYGFFEFNDKKLSLFLPVKNIPSSPPPS